MYIVISHTNIANSAVCVRLILNIQTLLYSAKFIPSQRIGIVVININTRGKRKLIF
jgi:hypothetical protein